MKRLLFLGVVILLASSLGGTVCVAEEIFWDKNKLPDATVTTKDFKLKYGSTHVGSFGDQDIYDSRKNFPQGEKSGQVYVPQQESVQGVPWVETWSGYTSRRESAPAPRRSYAPGDDFFARFVPWVEPWRRYIPNEEYTPIEPAVRFQTQERKRDLSRRPEISVGHSDIAPWQYEVTPEPVETDPEQTPAVIHRKATSGRQVQQIGKPRATRAPAGETVQTVSPKKMEWGMDARTTEQKSGGKPKFQWGR